MRYDCPACGETLRFKLLKFRPVPQPGVSVWQRQFARVCRFCGGYLDVNLHPLEKRVAAVGQVTFVLLFVVVGPLLPAAPVRRVGLALFSLYLCFFGFIRYRYLRDWQRCKVFGA